ncbi:PAS domain S-box protein [Bacillus tianshenii]|nr:PAS domain S-box protein [Bacillus tianshenii]
MLKTALEELNEGIMIVDLNSEVQYINKAYEKMFNVSRDDVLGKWIPHLQVSLQEHLKIMNDTIRLGKGHEVEEIYLSDELILTAYTKFIETEESTTIMGHFEDITHIAHRKVQHEQRIEEMTANLVPITNDFALLSLHPLFMDAQKDILINKVPDECVKFNVNFLAIQMHNIGAVDAEFSLLLDNLIKVLSLLGVKPVIIGLKPEVAAPFVKNNLHFAYVPCFMDIPSAIAYFDKQKA